jgi:hypothetical protein
MSIQVLRRLLENARRSASKLNTPLTCLSEGCPQQVPEAQPRGNAPIVRRLSGVLPADISIQDYRDHLEKNYGS